MTNVRPNNIKTIYHAKKALCQVMGQTQVSIINKLQVLHLHLKIPSSRKCSSLDNDAKQADSACSGPKTHFQSIGSLQSCRKERVQIITVPQLICMFCGVTSCCSIINEAITFSNLEHKLE